MTDISRDEIYHRLEWYFKASHDPEGPHVILPTAPIGQLQTVTLPVLFTNINKASSTYVPAWDSTLFNGVHFPFNSTEGSPGIADVQTFGDLINCAAAAYANAGWDVT